MLTTVHVSGPARFDMTGRRLTDSLYTVPETISPGLAARLQAYAAERMDEAGFKQMVSEWTVEVYTVDGDKKPTDRTYCVRFMNGRGGYVEVIGILTRRGWPSLDHGFDIGCE